MPTKKQTIIGAVIIAIILIIIFWDSISKALRIGNARQGCPNNCTCKWNWFGGIKSIDCSSNEKTTEQTIVQPVIVPVPVTPKPNPKCQDINNKINQLKDKIAATMNLNIKNQLLQELNKLQQVYNHMKCGGSPNPTSAV